MRGGALHDDRLEIWTPGKLAEGLTIEKLYKTHGSYPVEEDGAQ